MRTLCFCLCICLLLAGCAIHPVFDTTMPPAESTVPVPVNRIDTTYFSLTVPDSWLGDASWMIRENPEDGSYDVRFSENQSAQDAYGGHLFTISVLAHTMDYTQFPSYEILGSITTDPGVAYNIVILYPTDVQFSPDGAQRYQAMYEEIPGIIQTICYHSCMFSTQAVPAIPLQ